MASLFATMRSPVGTLTLVARSDALVAVLWPKDDARRVRVDRGSYAPEDRFLREVAGQLSAYFEGRRTVFSLPLAFQGTDFQRRVWEALIDIPYGETRSYGELARIIGMPKAIRAVGAANGRNPISIIAPCHRVIGAAGALTGFAGGLPAKRHLLALETQHARAGTTQPTLF